MQDMTKPSKRDSSKKDLGLFFTKKDLGLFFTKNDLGPLFTKNNLFSFYTKKNLGTQKIFLNKTNKTPKGRVFDKTPKA